MQFQTFTAQYVESLTKGDVETERHFADYFGELLRIKLRKTWLSPQALEDVRQETFLRVLNVLRRKKGLVDPEKLGAFVNGVCGNVLIEHYRSASRQRPTPELSEDIAEPSPNPEAEYVTEECKRSVRAILEMLPARDRQILRLLFLEEREKEEVCRICHVDRGYLRVLLHRAKIRFREGAAKINTASTGFR